jgi:hypothetical protein
MAATSARPAHPLIEKLRSSGSLTPQELQELQSHIDQLERRALAAHGDTVQSSHFHPSAFLEAGGGRPQERG